MQSAYSWMGTRIHLLLEDDLAQAYNRAQDAYTDAQISHEIIHGKPWDPITEALAIGWTEEERQAWDKIAQIINLLVEINGQGGLDIQEEEITSDYLVKLG